MPLHGDHTGGHDALVKLVAAMSSSRKLVKKQIDGGNLAVPCDDEIRPGVSWRLAGTAPKAVSLPVGPYFGRCLARIAGTRARNLEPPTMAA
jgi:hypothetical protein